MKHWWRAYDHSVDNAKLQRLPGDLFKSWYNLCCLASANDGVLPSLPDIAFKLRLSETKALAVIETLRSAKLIDGDTGHFEMHDWNEYQYKSDVSTERVQRYRKQQRNVSSTVSETANETAGGSSVKRSDSVSVLLSSSATPLESKEDSEEQACGWEFQEFWRLFPNKIGKKAAFASFRKARKGVDFEHLMKALEAYIRKTDDRPWCNPATWLNQGRWDDQPAQTPVGGAVGVFQRLERDLESAADRETGEDTFVRLPARQAG